MARFGGIASSAEQYSGAVRAGTVAFAAALSKTVTFGSVMPNTSYRVSLQSDVVLTAPPIVTNKTVNGFDITLGGVITGNLDYIAMGDS